MADELYLLAIGWISVRETWNQVPYDWLNGLIYLDAYASVVLTSDISDITISIGTRRTEDFCPNFFPLFRYFVISVCLCFPRLFVLQFPIYILYKCNRL